MTITAVGTTGTNGTGITFTPALAMAHSQGAVYAAVTPAGSTNIRVASITNFAAGQTDQHRQRREPGICDHRGGWRQAVRRPFRPQPPSARRTSRSPASPAWSPATSSGSVQARTRRAPSSRRSARQARAVPASTLTSGLTKDHVSGSPVTGNILVLTSGLTLSHAVTTANAAAIPVVTLTPAGATNIKVVNVAGFVAGQTINIDTGANLETATIATVGTAGATGTGLDLDGGPHPAAHGRPAVVQTEPAAHCPARPTSRSTASWATIVGDYDHDRHRRQRRDDARS